MQPERQAEGDEGNPFVRFAMGYKLLARPCNGIGFGSGCGLRLLGAAAVALFAGACSLSLPFMSLQDEPETTASISARPVSQLDPSLDEEDWRRARAALSLAVDPQGPGLPVNWDNPLTRRKGSFAAAGDMKLQDDTICRPFAAALVQPGGKEVKLAGEACRTGPGEWAMRLDPAAPTKEALAQPLPAKTSAALPATPAVPASRK